MLSERATCTVPSKGGDNGASWGCKADEEKGSGGVKGALTGRRQGCRGGWGWDGDGMGFCKIGRPSRCG